MSQPITSEAYQRLVTELRKARVAIDHAAKAANDLEAVRAQSHADAEHWKAEYEKLASSEPVTVGFTLGQAVDGEG